MDNLQFCILSNSISVIWEDDNERLCAVEPDLWLERFLPPWVLKPGTNRSAGQCLTYCATRAPLHFKKCIMLPFYIFHNFFNLYNMNRAKQIFGWINAPLRRITLSRKLFFPPFKQRCSTKFAFIGECLSMSMEKYSQLLISQSQNSFQTIISQKNSTTGISK